MSEKEVRKFSVIDGVIKGKYTVPQAARLLKLSERQIQRLKRSVLLNGVDGVIHKNKGRKPINAPSAELEKKIVALKGSYEYEKANITHFSELLAEHEDINISYSSLYRLLAKNNIKSRRAHKKPKLHHSRKRRDCFGELIQTDGTPFDWFETGEKYSLHAYIDDATGIPLGLYMCKQECLLGYLEITRQMLTNFGIPVSIYSDKFSVFFPPTGTKLSLDEELAGKNAPETQYFRILNSLNIDLIPASSPQAKGRVERLWNTLQDRLITEFRIRKINNMEDANNFFPEFIKEFAKKFAVEPKSKDSKFIELVKKTNLDDLLVMQFSRVIDNSGTFTFYKKKFQVITNKIPPKTKVNVLISHKIGVKVAFDGKKYDVLSWDDLPTHNSSKDLNEMFKKTNYKLIDFAKDIMTQDAKKTSPLLASS